MKRKCTHYWIVDEGVPPQPMEWIMTWPIMRNARTEKSKMSTTLKLVSLVYICRKCGATRWFPLEQDNRERMGTKLTLKGKDNAERNHSDI